MQTRYLIAVDQNGVYLRETLCVTRRHESGEVEYYTKPVADGELSTELAACMSAVRRALREWSRRRQKAAQAAQRRHGARKHGTVQGFSAPRR